MPQRTLNRRLAPGFGGGCYLRARPLPCPLPALPPAPTHDSRSVIARFIGQDGVRLWRGVQEAIRKHYGLERMREVRKTVSRALGQPRRNVGV